MGLLAPVAANREASSLQCQEMLSCTISQAVAAATGSTRIVSARRVLNARRALYTRQMTFVPQLSSLMTCSSPSPISRKRWPTSCEAESCLTRTATPARTRFNGQSRLTQQAGSPTGGDCLAVFISVGTNLLSPAGIRYPFLGGHSSLIAISSSTTPDHADNLRCHRSGGHPGCRRAGLPAHCPGFFSLSHDEGVGEGWGEGNSIGQASMRT